MRQLSEVLDSVGGRAPGYKETLYFASLREARLYRQALYDCRRRTKWPAGADPWGDIKMRLMQVGESPMWALELYRGWATPKWVPEPIGER